MNNKQIVSLFIMIGMILGQVIYLSIRFREFPIVIKVTNNIIDTVYIKHTPVYPEKTVTATIYHAVKEQTNSEPFITASGLEISSIFSAHKHKYIAVSRDLLKYFKFGDIVKLSGTDNYDGIYMVADVMNERFNNYVDILTSPDKPAEWKQNCKIIKIK